MDNTAYKNRLNAYISHLEQDEKSRATIAQYRRDIICFFEYLGSAELTKEAVLAYKRQLELKYMPVSVNAKLSALNSFFPLQTEPILSLSF